MNFLIILEYVQLQNYETILFYYYSHTPLSNEFLLLISLMSSSRSITYVTYFILGKLFPEETPSHLSSF